MDTKTEPYGAKDVALDLLKGQARYASDQVSEARMQTCRTCPEFRTVMRVCGACGCYLPAKVKFEKSSCPKGRW